MALDDALEAAKLVRTAVELLIAALFATAEKIELTAVRVRMISHRVNGSPHCKARYSSLAGQVVSQVYI